MQRRFMVWLTVAAWLMMATLPIIIVNPFCGPGGCRPPAGVSVTPVACEAAGNVGLIGWRDGVCWVSSPVS